MELEVDSPLLATVDIEYDNGHIATVDVKYHWQPSRCSGCHVFGHSEASHKVVAAPEGVGLFSDATGPVVVEDQFKLVNPQFLPR